MSKNAAMTIRLSESLKRSLEDRARLQRRSLSAQALHDLESAANAESQPGLAGKLLGLFKGAPLPTQKDLKRVRAMLWGHMGRRLEIRG